MSTQNWTLFEEVLDETVTVIREDFISLIKNCKSPLEIKFAILEELDDVEPDFIKIIALSLAREVLVAR